MTIIGREKRNLLVLFTAIEIIVGFKVAIVIRGYTG
jgi:hypothetical protein